jgi:glycosyltransferase involved in cell wall biosynthesis
MPRISAVFITQDEERHIQAAVESARFCDEVLVVDSGSRDATRALAEKAGARVLVNTPWPGFVAQRNFAVGAAQNDWVLCLDADERVSEALRAEIVALRSRGFAGAAYAMPRVAHYLGTWIRCTDWYPDRQVRLFDRTRAAWAGGRVHESVRAQGAVARLRGEIEHHPYADVAHHLRKMDTYAELWARDAWERGRRTGLAELATVPAWTFFRNYVLRRGFVLGGTGFVISRLNSTYTFAKLAKLYERQSASR